MDGLEKGFFWGGGLIFLHFMFKIHTELVNVLIIKPFTLKIHVKLLFFHCIYFHFVYNPHNVIMILLH